MPTWFALGRPPQGIIDYLTRSDRFVGHGHPRPGVKAKSHHHLRGGEIDALCGSIESFFDVALADSVFEATKFADVDCEVVLVDGEPVVVYVDDQPFLTVKGANQLPPTTNVITIDANAVSPVFSGADVTRPGTTKADEPIEAGGLVVIAEETHDKVLAMGRALEDRADLIGDSGKVVESIHHIGDDLLEFSV